MRAVEPIMDRTIATTISAAKHNCTIFNFEGHFGNTIEHKSFDPSPPQG